MNGTKDWKKEEPKDLGLGNKTSDATNGRYVNKDGSFNVRRTGLPFSERVNYYHAFLEMSWMKFTSIVVLFYFFANLFFATLFLLAGFNNLRGAVADTLIKQFCEAFFFSAQTITTLGYGRISPDGLWTNILASSESLLGLLCFALVTGLIYGRFSKPVSRIAYSHNAVVAPFQNINGFMFRMANKLSSQLIEAEVQLVMAYTKSVNGEPVRKFVELPLERKKLSFFPSNWTIVHPIDEESPMYNASSKDLEEWKAEFFIILKAFDDSFSQTIYSRNSYLPSEVKWGQKFVSMLRFDVGSHIEVEMDKISETVEVKLN